MARTGLTLAEFRRGVGVAEHREVSVVCESCGVEFFVHYTGPADTWVCPGCVECDDTNPYMRHARNDRRDLLAAIGMSHATPQEKKRLLGLLSQLWLRTQDAMQAERRTYVE